MSPHSITFIRKTKKYILNILTKDFLVKSTMSVCLISGSPGPTNSATKLVHVSSGIDMMILVSSIFAHSWQRSPMEQIDFLFTVFLFVIPSVDYRLLIVEIYLYLFVVFWNLVRDEWLWILQGFGLSHVSNMRDRMTHSWWCLHKW